ARESYDVTMMKLQDWVRVLTMSAPNVANMYRGLYSPGNENNPYKIYGRERAIRVNILSIVLLGNVPGHTPTGATVRFQRSVYDKTSGSTQPLDNRIATLAFAYKPDLRMDERYRIENPLGFQVTDYRVSTDYASTPPKAVAATGPDSARSEARAIEMQLPEAMPSDGALGTLRPSAPAPAQSLRGSDTPIPTPSFRGPGQP
ncbi:MAG: VirB8/TrbF family protein, partial [Rhodanobacteraceae bacterium]